MTRYKVSILKMHLEIQQKKPLKLGGKKILKLPKKVAKKDLVFLNHRLITVLTVNPLRLPSWF